MSSLNIWKLYHFGVDPDPRIHASDADPDPAIFFIDLQEANKKLIFCCKIYIYIIFER